MMSVSSSSSLNTISFKAIVNWWDQRGGKSKQRFTWAKMKLFTSNGRSSLNREDFTSCSDFVMCSVGSRVGWVHWATKKVRTRLGKSLSASTTEEGRNNSNVEADGNTWDSARLCCGGTAEKIRQEVHNDHYEEIYNWYHQHTFVELPYVPSYSVQLLSVDVLLEEPLVDTLPATQATLWDIPHRNLNGVWMGFELFLNWFSWLVEIIISQPWYYCLDARLCTLNETVQKYNKSNIPLMYTTRQIYLLDLATSAPRSLGSQDREMNGCCRGY